MLKRKEKIIIRKAVLFLIGLLTALCLAAALGIGGLHLTVAQVEGVSLILLIVGLIFLFVNDNRMLLFCFACSAVLAFLVHEKTISAPLGKSGNPLQTNPVLPSTEQIDTIK